MYRTAGPKGLPYREIPAEAAVLQAWPGAAYEQQTWGSELYESAVIPEISDLDPRVNSRTQALAEQSTIEMVRLDAELGDEASLASLLVEAEATSSSRIEDLYAGAQAFALARLEELLDAPVTVASLVASNAAAVRSATELSGDLSLKSIVIIHHVLLKASDKSNAGRYRTAQGWVGGRSPLSADYVPPEPERVIGAVSDLANFMHRDDIPALIHTALAHAQFEAIHPFAEGNGRTGRAVVSAVLRDKGITRKITIPLSSGLLTDTGPYYNALGECRGGNIQPIVELFAVAGLRAVHNSRLLADDVRAVTEDLEARFGDSPPGKGRLLLHGGQQRTGHRRECRWPGVQIGLFIAPRCGSSGSHAGCRIGGDGRPMEA